MNARLARRMLCAAIGLTAVMSGCVHENPEALQFIGNAVVLRQPGGGSGQNPGTCIQDQSQFYRTFGTMDLLMAQSYVMYAEMVNRLPPTSTASGNSVQQLRMDASFVTLQGVEITARILQNSSSPYKDATSLTTAQGWTRPVATTGERYFTKKWYVPASRTLESGQRAVLRFDLIPADVGAELRKPWFQGTNPDQVFADRYTSQASAVLTFSAEGKMADGTIVKAGSADYMINLCWGCLITVPTVPPPDENFGNSQEYLFQQCRSKLPPQIQYTPPCVPGNDEYVPCSFYCLMCSEDESVQGGDPNFVSDYKCDERFCPAALQ